MRAARRPGTGRPGSRARRPRAGRSRRGRTRACAGGPPPPRGRAPPPGGRAWSPSRRRRPAARGPAGPPRCGRCTPPRRGPGRAADTRSRKCQGSSFSSARSTTSAFTRMATNSSDQGRRLEPAVLPPEIVRPLDQDPHEPRVRIEDRQPQRACIRGGHPGQCTPPAERNPSRFYSFFTDRKRRVTDFPHLPGIFVSAMEAARQQRPRGDPPVRPEIEIRPDEFVALAKGRAAWT